MLTSEQLQEIMPRLAPAKLAEFLPLLTAATAEFAIDPPPRLAAFLAQLAHESAQFRFMEEIWGPTPAQKRYDPQSTLATSLGNTEPGDGLRFKGRGPIQVTGRANYQRYGDALGIDLIADPSRAASPDVAFRIAGLFWSKNGLNALADQVTDDAFKEITRRINGGFNGLADRQQFYAVARQVLGVTPPPATRGGPPRAAATESPFPRGMEAIRDEAARRRRPKRPAAKKARPRRPAGTAKRRSAPAKSRRRAPAARKRKAGKKR